MKLFNEINDTLLSQELLEKEINLDDEKEKSKKVNAKLVESADELLALNDISVRLSKLTAIVTSATNNKVDEYQKLMEKRKASTVIVKDAVVEIKKRKGRTNVKYAQVVEDIIERSSKKQQEIIKADIEANTSIGNESVKLGIKDPKVNDFTDALKQLDPKNVSADLLNQILSTAEAAMKELGQGIVQEDDKEDSKFMKLAKKVGNGIKNTIFLLIRKLTGLVKGEEKLANELATAAAKLDENLNEEKESAIAITVDKENSKRFEKLLKGNEYDYVKDGLVFTVELEKKSSDALFNLMKKYKVDHVNFDMKV